MLCVRFSQCTGGEFIWVFQTPPRCEFALCFAPWLNTCSKSGPVVPPDSPWEVGIQTPGAELRDPDEQQLCPFPALGRGQLRGQAHATLQIQLGCAGSLLLGAGFGGLKCCKQPWANFSWFQANSMDLPPSLRT